jgi:hypothetical protein
VDGQETDGDIIVVKEARPGIYGLATGQTSGNLRLHMSAGSPNPFGETCAFLLKAPSGRRARMCVFDVRGRLVDVLFDGRTDGPTEIFWDGRNSTGARVSSGIYFVQARSGSKTAVSKVILVR